MAGIRTDNTFEGGLSFDSDKQKLQKNQYLDSINGSLLYNDQGSISWENLEGNRLHVTITPRNGTDTNSYIIIGNCHFPRFSIIFLVDPINGNSEIGMFNVNEDGLGQYKTLFNDQDDPNGEQLNFQATNQIDAKPLLENNKLIRTYWVDGVKDDSNNPRVFTLKYDDTLDPNDLASYTAVTTSVHAINAQADINFGLMKFKQYVSGNILSGSYKFTYRLRTQDGYASPWAPLTGRFDVTSDLVNSTNWHLYEMEGSGESTTKGMKLEIKGIDERYDIIQVAYVFFETPEVVADSKIFATFSISSDIHTVDFLANTGEPLNTDDISAVYTVIKRAKTLNFKDATLYYGNIVEGNLSFSKEEIDTVLENLTVEPKIRDMFSDETAYFKSSSPDPNNGEGIALNADEWEPPIDHQTPVASTTTTKPTHSGQNETYTIVNDYYNYKGTQVSHLYKGYFRGETYRFGIVFYDKKGLPGFVYHLCDFTFPDQYDTAYSWQRIKADTSIQSDSGNTTDPLWVTNDYNHLPGDKIALGQSLNNNYSDLRILGLEFSGIDISTIKDQISMVKIVRVKRDPKIMYQGINVPLIQERENNPGGVILSPMISIEHDWRNVDNLASDLDGALAEAVDPTKYVQYCVEDFYKQGAHVNLYMPDPNESAEDAASLMIAPDLEFDEQRIPIVQSGDGLKVVGSCYTYARPVANQSAKNFMAYYTYGLGTSNSDGGEPTNGKPRSFEALLKCYFTNNDYHHASNSPSAIYPRYGEIANILGSTSFLSRDELGGFRDGWISNFILYNEVQSYRDRAAGWDITVSDKAYSKSYVKQSAFYYKHDYYSGQGSTNAFAPILRHNKQASDYTGFPAVSGAGQSQDIFLNTRTNAYGFLIVNYYRPNSALYGGLSFTALEQNIFIDTGYQCTVGNTTFTDPVSDVIDGAEVWGGDCYLDYVGIQMYYPRLGWPYDSSNLINNGSSTITDSGNPATNRKVTGSVGVIIPLESDINHKMRSSNSPVDAIYGSEGARPFITYEFGNAATIKARTWRNGFYQYDADDKFLDEYNANEVMLLESIIKTYPAQPLFFDPNLVKYPVRWRYSQIKIYGDTIDTWRIYLANDFSDLQGRYGSISSSCYLFDQIYSLQERAFGKLRAFNRTGLVTPDQGNLTTGIGDALDGIDYISTQYGNQHQWSLYETDKAAYWVDIDKQKIMRFAQDGLAPISDFRSIHAFPKKIAKYFIGKDNPAYTEGIQTVYDYSNNRVIFLFQREKFIILNGSVFVTDNDFDLNDTLFYDVQSAGATINITTEYNIFYICLNQGIHDIGLTINGSSLRDLNPNSCYRITGVEGSYSVEEVTEGDITPFRYNLVYHEDMNVFVHWYSNKARYWLSYNAYILSVGFDALPTNGNKNKMWLHGFGSDYGSFYGVVHKSLLKLNVNDNAPLHKVFDSLRVNVNRDDLFSYFVYQTDTQNYWIELPTFNQVAYKENILRYPIRWFEQKDRTRGKFLSLSWDIDNTDNELVRISSIGTNYRLSNRM